MCTYCLAFGHDDLDLGAAPSVHVLVAQPLVHRVLHILPHAHDGEQLFFADALALAGELGDLGGSGIQYVKNRKSVSRHYPLKLGWPGGTALSFYKKNLKKSQKSKKKITKNHKLSQKITNNYYKVTVHLVDFLQSEQGGDQ